MLLLESSKNAAALQKQKTNHPQYTYCYSTTVASTVYCSTITVPHFLEPTTGQSHYYARCGHSAMASFNTILNVAAVHRAFVEPTPPGVSVVDIGEVPVRHRSFLVASGHAFSRGGTVENISACWTQKTDTRKALQFVFTIRPKRNTHFSLADLGCMVFSITLLLSCCVAYQRVQSRCAGRVVHEQTKST